MEPRMRDGVPIEVLAPSAATRGEFDLSWTGRLEALIRQGVVQTERVLPEQSGVDGRDLVPEERLLAAILEDAVRVVLTGRSGCGRSHREALRETWAWIDDPARGLFGFGSICERFGLEPDAVRSALARRGVLPLPEPVRAPKPRKTGVCTFCSRAIHRGICRARFLATRAARVDAVAVSA